MSPTPTSQTDGIADIANWGIKPEPDDAHHPPNQTLDFYGVDLRLSSIVEIIITQRDNTLRQVLQCACWYKEQARQELYPTRRAIASLEPENRRAILQRAIELAISDSRLRLQKPSLPEVSCGGDNRPPRSKHKYCRRADPHVNEPN